MSPSNKEFLAQLEKYASAQERLVALNPNAAAMLAGLDFPAILAAVKRWVKIEEAARECRDVEDFRLADDCTLEDAQAWGRRLEDTRATLDAALKEPS